MSELSSASIPSLNYDILMYIFTLNADMFADKHALRTTRMTSQVCREWRDLLLGASLLWARLIDLDVLDDNTRCYIWRNELVLRSGTAPLWIKSDFNETPYRKSFGSITVRNEDIYDFLCRIIRDNCHRIQKLIINSHDWNSVISPTMLCYPAPYLQCLTIPFQKVISRTTESVKDGSITPIFADHAPFLRELKLSGYTIHYQAPWLRQLRILHLDGGYNICEVLAVLSATHNLRKARLILTGRDDMTSPFLNAYLPLLEFLKLHVGLPDQGAIFLNHIYIPIDCFLSVRTDYSRVSHINASDYLPLICAFSRYVQRHLQSRPSNILEFNSAYLRRFIWKCHWSRVDSSEIGIRIVLPETIAQIVFETVLKFLACPELSSVAELQFYGWEQSEYPCSAIIRQFFKGLTSLHTLYCDITALAYLSEIQENMVVAAQPGYHTSFPFGHQP